MSNESILGRFRAQPENVTAIVNAVVVTLSPLAFMLGGSLLSDEVTNTSTTVRASIRPPLARFVEIVVMVVMTCAPAGVVAGWRTRVLTSRWLEDGSGDWRGVVEAGLAGGAIALLVLLPGIVTRPLEAPPYVAFYGTAAVLLGFLFGLPLRAVTLLTLRALGARKASRQGVH